MLPYYYVCVLMLLYVSSYEHICVLRYEELMPWVHYIPVRADLEDLEETLDRVLANDTLLMYVVREPE